MDSAVRSTTQGIKMNQAQIDKVQNEGGEGYSQAEVNQERAGLAKMAAEKAAFAAEWTVEVLAARKAAWNAEVHALIAAKKPMNARTNAAIVAKLGFGLTEINRAKALHA
jgi:hypothetical protein